MEKFQYWNWFFRIRGLSEKNDHNCLGVEGYSNLWWAPPKTTTFFDVDSNGCSEEGNGELLSEVKGRSIQSGHMKRIFYVTEKHWNEHAILVLVLVVFLTYVSVKVKR